MFRISTAFWMVLFFNIEPAFQMNVLAQENNLSVGDYAPYLLKVQERLSRLWRIDNMLGYPIKINFKVDKDGEVFDKQVVESSGDRKYDQAAFAEIGRLSPLPPYQKTSAHT